MDRSTILKEAQKFLAKGQIDRAIQEFEKLTDFDDGNIYNTLGDLYLKKGDIKKASENYYRAGQIFREKGFYDKAKALYKKLLNINSSDYRATLSLGEIAEEKGLTTEAIKYFLAVSELLLRANKRDELIEVCQRILNLQPSNLQMRIKIAELFSKQGFSHESAKQYAIIAKLYHDSGNLSEAKNYYKKTLSLHPSDRVANLGLADIYQKEGDHSFSVECLKRLLSINPEDPEILAQYLKALSLTGDMSSAREELERLVELDPSNIMAKKYLASIYIKDNQKEEAWNLISPSIDQIISFDRNTIIPMLEELKDVKPAECTKKLVVIYKEIGEMDKAFQELVNLGNYYLNLGFTEEAISCYKEAQNIRPDDTYLRTKLLKIETTSKNMQTVQTFEEEKGLEQILQEVDIYLKFGLYDEAKKRLEPLKARYQEELDLHLKFKQLYVDLDDKEMAVTECLNLMEIYRRRNMLDEAEEVIREAISIAPDDPRLEVFQDLEKKHQKVEKFLENQEPFQTTKVEPQPLERTELEKVLYPTKEEISNKINEFSKSLTRETPINVVEETKGVIPLSEESQETQTEELESELLNNSELLNARSDLEETQKEPELSDQVMDIFEESKKGLKEHVKEEDSETHYNLGIAYKEMGLIDEAIKEFQLSRKDLARYIPSMNMLAVCYKKKGLNKLVIETLEEAMKGLNKTQEEYLALKYELADAYERDGDIPNAFNIYMEIYGIDSSFRDVSNKVELLKKNH